MLVAYFKPGPHNVEARPAKFADSVQVESQKLRGSDSNSVKYDNNAEILRIQLQILSP